MAGHQMNLGRNLVRLGIRDTLAASRNRAFGTSGVLGCKPISVNIEITTRCSLHCRTCNMWRAPDRDELSVGQWIEVIDALRRWLGVFRLTITGGEPLVKPGIATFLQHCVNAGLPVVIITNGYNLDEKLLLQMAELPLTQIVISLDSLNPQVHDWIRGVDGAFERTIGALRFLAEHQRPFLLGTSTIIMEQNLLELAAMATCFRAMGVDRIFFQPLQGGFSVPGSAGWPYSSPLWPSSPDRVQQGFDRLRSVACKTPLAHSSDELDHFQEYFLQGPTWQRPWRCAAGYTTFHCDALGRVRLCIPYPSHVGRVPAQHPADIWASEEAMRERTRIMACRQACLLSCNRQYTALERVQYARGWMARNIRSSTASAGPKHRVPD